MPLRFSKMHSLGNDFVVIDAIQQRLSMSGEFASFIADRRRGIGCDQILVAEPAPDDRSEFRFRIYNADGSEAGQCGNGARCFAVFLKRIGLTQSNAIRVATTTSRMTLHFLDSGQVRVDMGDAVLEPERVPFDSEHNTGLHRLQAGNDWYDFAVVSMGNPHAVTLVDDVRQTDVDGIGAEIEHHPRFPQRTNVGFMQILDRNNIRLRVFERGVGETQACGSGACAAAVCGQRQGLLDEAVEVALPGGNVEVHWQGSGTPVYLIGDAIHVFDGEIEQTT